MLKREQGLREESAPEPASVDYGIGLSAPVTAAVNEAVRVVLDLVAAAGTESGTEGTGSGREATDGTGQQAAAKG